MGKSNRTHLTACVRQSLLPFTAAAAALSCPPRRASGWRERIRPFSPGGPSWLISPLSIGLSVYLSVCLCLGSVWGLDLLQAGGMRDAWRSASERAIGGCVDGLLFYRRAGGFGCWMWLWTWMWIWMWMCESGADHTAYIRTVWSEKIDGWIDGLRVSAGLCWLVLARGYARDER